MPTISKDEAWLKQTKQMWKFWVFAALIFIAFALLLLRIITMAGPESKSVIIILCVLGFAVLFLLIKCPHCNKRPMYRIVKKADISTLTQTMLTFKKCPYCAYDGNPAQAERQKIV